MGAVEVNGYTIEPGANLQGADLQKADLTGADLAGADLEETNLSWAKLCKANLFKANLKNANLFRANLEYANLYVASLYGASLDGAILRLANLELANLSGADLDGANLSQANLAGTNLREASLVKATPYRANLSGANLELANLDGAILRLANLRGANLRGANLRDPFLNPAADLSGAFADKDTQWPDGFDPEAAGVIFTEHDSHASEEQRKPLPISVPPVVHRFSDWPIGIPAVPGAYAIWRGEILVYAGEAGKNWTAERPGAGHLKGRLSDHANAQRADVFPTYVFERFVGRHLSEVDWLLIEAGERHMTEHAREFIRAELSFSFATTSDHKEALDWERRIRTGELGTKPLINPL